MECHTKPGYVLVLEDDPATGEAIETYLQEEGVQVERAESPVEADEIVERCLKEGLEPRHYLGDYNLGLGRGGCTGLGYGQNLTKRFPKMGITLFTGSVNEPAVQEFKEYGEVIDKHSLDGLAWDRVRSLARRLREQYFC